MDSCEEVEYLATAATEKYLKCEMDFFMCNLRSHEIFGVKNCFELYTSEDLYNAVL